MSLKPIATLFHLFRPITLCITIIAPLAGFFLAHRDLPPVTLLAAALTMGMALALDSVIEAYRIHPDSNETADLDEYIEIVRKGRAFLFIGYFGLIVWDSPTSLLTGIVLYLFARTYNDAHIRARSHPPLGLLSHLGITFSFYILGMTWWPPALIHPVTPGVSLALIMGGGYLNHLRLNEERDEKMGLTTLAHRLGRKNLHALAALFLLSGDVTLGLVFLRSDARQAFLFLLLGCIMGIFSLAITHPRRFRLAYRLLHLAAGVAALSLYVLFPVVK